MGCLFLAVEKAWWATLDHELASGHLSEDLKMQEHVISAALSFSHSQIFISSYVELMLDLVWTLTCRLQTCHSRMTLHYSIPLGLRPFFFSEAYFYPKNRTVSVSTGTLLFVSVVVVAMQQNPQGGGVLALVENTTDLSIPRFKFSSVVWSTVVS